MGIFPIAALAGVKFGKIVGRFDARAQRIYNDRFFKSNANKVTCRYCPFSPRGTGACPVGV